MLDYVIAVQTPAYPLSPATFAIESAFAEHLRHLRKVFATEVTRVVLVAPELSGSDYEAQKHHLATIDLASDDIAFVPAYPQSVSTLGFWRKSLSLWRRLRQVTGGAFVVHSGMSFDMRKPMLAMINLAAWRAGRPVIFIVDIDFRKDAWRYRRLGQWGVAKYLVNQFVFNPFRKLQVWLAPRMFQLVMLKSASMVEDYGKGRPNVKDFYDTVHSEQQVLTQSELDARCRQIANGDGPLETCYFGRLVRYKGVREMVSAVGIARTRGRDVRLTIVGDGPEREDLLGHVASLGLSDHVTFARQVAYGAPLFSLLSRMHLALSAPLVEDTPRASFDAMARGLPILAFDISYFRDLAAASGDVALAQWPEPASLADRLAELDQNRHLLAEMAVKGVDFARKNTQQIWLERRAEWTRRYCCGISAKKSPAD